MDTCNDENMFERLSERIAILREQYQRRGGQRFSIPYELREELVEAVQASTEAVPVQRWRAIALHMLGHAARSSASQCDILD